MVSSNALLNELETLPYADRIRRMVELGKLARQDSEAAKTLSTLEQGGFYERLLALAACFGSKDGNAAARAIRDPSRIIQGRAVGLLGLFGSAFQVVDALREARSDLRLSLLRRAEISKALE